MHERIFLVLSRLLDAAGMQHLSKDGALQGFTLPVPGGRRRCAAKCIGEAAGRSTSSQLHGHFVMMAIDNPLGFPAFEHLGPHPSLEPGQPDVATKIVFAGANFANCLMLRSSPVVAAALSWATDSRLGTAVLGLPKARSPAGVHLFDLRWQCMMHNLIR